MRVARLVSARREQLDKGRVLFMGKAGVRSHVRKLTSAPLGIGSSRILAEIATLQDCTVEEGEEAQFLAPLPPSLLPLSEEALRRCQLLGLRRIAQLQQFSAATLYDGFGEEGLLLHELVRGIDRRRVVPESDEELLVVEAPPEEGLHRPLQELFAKLEGRICKRLTLQVGKHSLNLGFTRGITDPLCAERHIHEQLRTLQLEEMPENLRIGIAEWSTPEERQLSLLQQQRLPRFRQPHALMRVVWDDPESRLPERRAHLESLVEAGVERPLYTPKPWSGALQGKLLEQWELEEEWWSERPIRRTYQRRLMENGARICLFREEGSWFRQ